MSLPQSQRVVRPELHIWERCRKAGRHPQLPEWHWEPRAYLAGDGTPPELGTSRHSNPEEHTSPSKTHETFAIGLAAF
jgi:hypothetical protein